MLSAARSLSGAKELGRPLPRLEELAELHDGEFKFRFRGSQVTVIGGEPGAQKSGFATWLVARWNLPTLFFSADTDQATAVARLIGAASGAPYTTVMQAFNTGNEGFYEDILEKLNVNFSYKPDPDLEDIWAEVDAYVEAWDSFPRVIVIDNLLDVMPPSGDNETSGYKAILLEVKKLARRTGACVLILHHMREESVREGRREHPPSRARLMGRVSQTPENVLSVALVDGEVLAVCPVKHRGGPSDKDADKFVKLWAHPERTQFSKWVSLEEQVNGTSKAIQEFWKGIE